MSLTKENIDKYEFIGRMNVIYHERSERYFQKFISGTNFLSIILSSVAIASLGEVFSLLPKEIFASFLAITIAIINGAVLGFDMSNKKELHRDLKRQWISFQSLIYNTTITLEEIEKQKNEINASEPAPSRRRLIHAQELASEALNFKVIREPSALTKFMTLIGITGKEQA